jgi:hypothetical protein
MKVVDLPAMSAFTGVPHATLRSWAKRQQWPVHGYDDDKRKLYEYRLVRRAVLDWENRKLQQQARGSTVAAA